jgi:Alkylmercury lyase
MSDTSVSADEAVRRAVYDTLSGRGRAPSIHEIALLTGISDDDAHDSLISLAAAHAVVLTPAGDAVRMAHPFSAAPMGFVVAPAAPLDDRLWWGGCAWDSFGLSAAMKLDVVVATRCPWCGTEHRFTAGPDLSPPAGPVVRFPLPARQWWDDVVATCSAIRLFCSDDHARQWSVEHAGGAGEFVDVTSVWRLAQPWYGDRLASDFRPHTTAYNQQLLTDVGLTGDFWQLP